jgi:hypothetical protein
MGVRDKPLALAGSFSSAKAQNRHLTICNPLPPEAVRST